MDRELRTSVGNVVVVQRTRRRRTQRRSDVISRRTGILSGHTAVGRCYPVARYEAASTANSQRSRIRVTIDLAVGISRPGRITLVDRELRTSVGNVVVVQRTGNRRTQRRSDVIRRRTGILARHTAVARSHSVSRHETAATASG